MKLENADIAAEIIRKRNECIAAIEIVKENDLHSIFNGIRKICFSILPLEKRQIIKRKMIEGLEEKIAELEAELEKL